MQATAQEIRQFVVDNFLFGRDGDGLGEDDSFLENGIIDSTGVLELVAFIEEKYGVSVLDHELVPENFDSLRNLGHYLDRKLGEKQAGSHAG